MKVEIFKAMLLNIGLLVLVANVLAGMRVVKRIIVYEEDSMKEQIVLMAIFSTITVISNYTGYSVNGAIANTRVIGVVASGFLGGPAVALVVGLVAGLHRYLIDINGFSTLACSISTVIGGIISAMMSRQVKENKYRSWDLFLITFVVECIQMIIILLIARPFSEAFLLVKNIFLPMTVFNSAGMVLFVGVFKNIIKDKEYSVGRKVGLVFEITEKCLPIVEKGDYNETSCNKIGETILNFSDDLAVVFTDTERIISVNGEIELPANWKSSMPAIAQKVLEEGEVVLEEDSREDDIFHIPLKNMVAISAPLVKWNKVFGTMTIFSRKHRISYYSQILFAEGLSKLLSTKSELADMEKQKELLVKSEYKALQSQINPHFIFNSLNTISSFVREKPEDARELLVALATYFRNSIKTKDALVSIYDEMEYVDAFLQLVNARFGDRLKVSIDIPNGLNIKVPCLIVQPIVENAVMHGAMSRKNGQVNVSIKERIDGIIISVSDNGHGISEDLIEGLKNDNINEDSIGLGNVHKRLCYIYGQENGLDIISSPSGTTVNINILKNQPLIKLG